MTEGVNTFFLTFAGALVFIMHAGFAMVRPAAPARVLGEEEGVVEDERATALAREILECWGDPLRPAPAR